MLLTAAGISSLWRLLWTNIPWALFRLAYKFGFLNHLWRHNVVGSSRGDTVVPESSQYIPASTMQNPSNLTNIELDTAVHIGKYSEYQVTKAPSFTGFTACERTRLAVVQFQRSTEVTPSNLDY